jgi:hypothetical protein
MAANRQLDLAALALIALACMGIEHRNHGTIDITAGQRAAAACPENESTPYSPECFDFIADPSRIDGLQLR